MGNGPPAYVGRFAPSPTGALHAGSLVAALASWLDARAHNGHWLVRIEDVDTPRCVPGADTQILKQLTDCGLHPDEPPLWQSKRGTAYREALDHLTREGHVFACACSRRDIEDALARQGQPRDRHGERVYPGTCRAGLQGRPARAWRFRVPPDAQVSWTDRRLGPQQQDVGRAVGDFVLLRSDGLWAYQLAVVVDDAMQGVTDVVRGEDLADNTARQILLHRALGLSQPRYLHTPLVCGPDGDKLSKQNGATALDTGNAGAVLNAAASTLGLPAASGPVADRLAHWVAQWRHRYAPNLQSAP